MFGSELVAKGGFGQGCRGSRDLLVGEVFWEVNYDGKGGWRA